MVRKTEFLVAVLDTRLETTLVFFDRVSWPKINRRKRSVSVKIQGEDTLVTIRSFALGGKFRHSCSLRGCLLYTSDAADDC